MKQEDIGKYLPKYLSIESENALRDALNEFPKLDPSRYYTFKLSSSSILYQGDGIKNLLIVNLPSIEFKRKDSMVISNTCDIDFANPRLYESRILYSPVILLKDYERVLLEESHKAEKVQAHLESIKRQEITSVFYLPELPNQIDESIVFFDRILNMSNHEIDRTKLSSERRFTLSTFGHYLFLLKLSFHLSRVQEGIDRDNP